jgi:hypothetical protein
MDLEIVPKVKVKATINNPLSPEEVMGFFGRNKTLGRDAVVMKAEAVIENRVYIPTGASDGLLAGENELIVILEDRVLAMGPDEFIEEYQLNTLHDDGKKVTMNFVSADSSAFSSWDRDDVEVSLS